MAAKIIIRKELPVGVTLAKFLPQFQAEFAELDAIIQASPQVLTTGTVSTETVDDVQITITESTYSTVEEAVDASTRALNWPHEAVIAYNQANNVLTFNKIVNEDTGEVVQDWTQRW
jgi:hypothetical protein